MNVPDITSTNAMNLAEKRSAADLRRRQAAQKLSFGLFWLGALVVILIMLVVVGVPESCMPPWSIPGIPLMLGIPLMPPMPHWLIQPCIVWISGPWAALICLARSTTRGSMPCLARMMSLISMACW